MRAVTRSVFLALGLTAVALPTTAAPKPHKTHVDEGVSRAVAHGDRARVIVRTKPGASSAMRGRLELRGKHVRTEHPGIDALTVTVDASEIRHLALDPAVESISLDANLSADGASNRNSKSTPTGSTSTPTSTSTSSTSISSYTTLPDGLRQAL